MQTRVVVVWLVSLGVMMPWSVCADDGQSERWAEFVTALTGLHDANEDQEEAFSAALDGGLKRMEATQREHLDQLLAINAAPLAAVMALIQPTLRPVRDWSQGYAMLVPDLMPLRLANRLLAVRFELAVSSKPVEGEKGSELVELRHALQLCDVIASDELLITQLCRIGMLQTVLDTIERCSSSVDALRRASWVAALPAAASFDGMFASCMRRERQMLLELQRKGQLQQLHDFSLLERPFLNSDAIATATLLERAAVLMAGPAHRQRSALAKFDQELERISSQVQRPIARLAMVAVSRLAERQMAFQARFALWQAREQFETHHRAHGVYPTVAVVEDPCNGQPLQVDPAGSRLLSVGPDGQMGTGDDIALPLDRQRG
jgi:hypothetical protein